MMMVCYGLDLQVDLVLTEEYQRQLSLTNLIAQFGRVDSVLLMLTMVYDLAVTLDASAVATQNNQDHTDHNHFRNGVHTTEFDLAQTVLWFGIVPQESPWALC